MKKFLILALALLVCLAAPVFAANSLVSNSGYRGISVDTDPNAEYASTPVNVGLYSTSDYIAFDLRGATYSATVTLQYKKSTDSVYTDYDSYTINTVLEISDRREGFLWRVNCKDAYTSGSFVSGIGVRKEK